MSPSKPVVFVVDDEQIIAKTLALILNGAGFAATPFDRGEKAIEATSTVTPEMLISDVVMPGMTGVELAIYFKKTQPACRILLFSGQTSTTDHLAEARRQGHDFDLISKPVHPADLLARLRSKI